MNQKNKDSNDYHFKVLIGGGAHPPQLTVTWPNAPIELTRYCKVITNGTYSCVLGNVDKNDDQWLLRVTLDESAIQDYRFHSQMAAAGLAPRVGRFYSGLFTHDYELDETTPMYAWLTERFETTLHDWLKGPNKPPQRYFRLYVWLTHLKPLLLRMHAQHHLIHGDLRWHMRNVVIRFNQPGNPSSGLAECRFIDFGFTRSLENFSSPAKYPTWYREITPNHNRNHGALIIFSKDDFNAEAKYELEQAEALLISKIYSAMLPRCAAPMLVVKPTSAAGSSLNTKKRQLVVA